jgi:peptidyl-prolyl cis-trans isomerase C
MIRRRRRRLYLSLLLPFFIFACHSRSLDPKKTPVITVNGQNLLGNDFGVALGRRLKLYDALAAKDPTNIKKAQESVLKEFIVSALLSQYAKEKGLSVSDEEVMKELDRIRKTYPDDLTFKAALASEDKNIEDWKKELSQTLLERKAFSTLAPELPNQDKIYEGEAKRYYDAHKSDFQHPAQVKLQQILVPTEDDAERILHSLKGAPFSDLAKKYSISPEGISGGDLGYVSKGLNPAFDAAFNLKVGQVSPIIKSSYGFHIIKVLDKKPSGIEPFEKVRLKLIRAEESKREQVIFDDWLANTAKSAKIERNDSLLEKIKVRTEGEGE